MTRLLTALLAVGLFACGTPIAPPAPGTLAKSEKQRITAGAPAADLEAAVASNLAFAIDVHRKLAAEPKNSVFSPHSITTALAMTYAGAKGDTQKAFEQTLHLTLPPAQFHRAMNDLDAQLSSRGQGAQGKNGKPFRLTPVNQVFAQQGFHLEPAYLDVLGQEYGAGVRLLNFAEAAQQSTDAINDWVNQSTEGLIPRLMDTVSSDARLVLVNAIYFNAAWAKQFDKNDTRDADFTLLDGSTKRVPTMSGQGLPGGHGVLNGAEVVELPYDGGEVSMVLIAPPVGQLPAFEAALTPKILEAHLAAVQGGSVNVTLPRFDFKTRKKLKELLTELGLGIAFSDKADLSGMNGTGGLTIFDVTHEAVVKTDEAGTEAAAATGVEVGVTSLPSFIEINRPFLFLVRDVKTKSVLFMGRVVAP